MTHEALAQEVSPYTLEENIAYMGQSIERLAAEAPGLAETKQYPERHFQDERVRAVGSQLRAEGADLSNVPKYYELFAKEMELRTLISGRPAYNHPFTDLIYKLGEDLVGRALEAEPQDGTLHRAMIEDLTDASERSPSSVTTELNVLKTAYKLQTVTELLGVQGDEYSDKLHDILLTEETVKWIRHIDEDQSPSLTRPEQQDATRKWMSEAVEAVTGIPADEASNYVFTASRRGESADIISILKKLDHFGVARIRELTRATDIRSLEAYSEEQLELMEAFAHDPAQVAEHLARHDTTVILVNRIGDHNGVLGNIAQEFDDSSQRTLFFEINHISDIYRQMSKLHRVGIKPATLVLAAHSNPGEFIVSDVRDRAYRRHDIATVAGRKLVAMVNSGDNRKPGEHGYSMHDMKGMARMVDEYMQPSRTIDDHDSDKGREKIIFVACYAASEVAAQDINDERSQTGVQSVISQLGNDLVTSGTKANIDIYGATEGIQIQKNEHGIQYTGAPALGEQRPLLPARRIRIENGSLTQETVQDILLRK